MAIKEIMAEFKELAQKVPNAKLCLEIIDYLRSEKQKDLEFITYRSLQIAIGNDVRQEDLIAAVNLLSTHRNALLNPHMMFVEVDGDEFEISADEYQTALNDGFLVHPETGDLVSDFNNRLFPFFTLGEILTEEIN